MLYEDLVFIFEFFKINLYTADTKFITKLNSCFVFIIEQLISMYLHFFFSFPSKIAPFAS